MKMRKRSLTRKTWKQLEGNIILNKYFSSSIKTGKIPNDTQVQIIKENLEFENKKKVEKYNFK